MILTDAHPETAKLMGLGCRVVGNAIICEGVALNEDISGETLEVKLTGDNGELYLTVKAQPVPKTDNLYDRWVEEMRFEITQDSR